MKTLYAAGTVLTNEKVPVIFGVFDTRRLAEDWCNFEDDFFVPIVVNCPLTINIDSPDVIFPNREDELIKLLKDHIVLVTFTKKNGDERVMLCTRKAMYIENELASGSSKKKANNDVIAVWSFDDDEWRSFRKDSVIEHQVIS
jgi:hypothetical protein